MNTTDSEAALLAAEIERNVAAALAEDVGSGDLTAQLVAADARARATIVSREDAVLCGTAWFTRCFETLDPAIRVVWHAAAGERVAPDQILCEIEGPARALLTGERTALNFLQLLSGVATKARRYSDAIAGTRAQVVDTRKTLPGLRLAHLCEAHVVEQDHRRPRRERFLEFVERLDFDLDELATSLRRRSDGMRGGNCGGDTAGGDDVVFLNKDRIVEAEAVIATAAALDRELLCKTQSG